MKKSNSVRKRAGGPGPKPVRVEFNDPRVETVAIAGDFNDWRPEAAPMIHLGGGHWVKDLVLPAGVYEYRLVVDGEWMPDPQAADRRPNPFGGANSILTVMGNHRPE